MVQRQAIEVIRALKNVKDAKKQVKQAQEDYRAYKKDIKRLEVELAAIAQDYKDKTPGITYDDVIEMREIVEATKDDEDWYKAGVVAATVNMAAKVTAVIQQTVALATSTGTYGFNAGVQLDVKGSKSRTEEHQSTSLASNIVGQNITIQTGGDEAQGSQTTIQGSHLQANNAINIDTGQLNIQASKDRYQMTKDTESIEISVQQTVYGAAGGPSVSGSLERSRDKAAESTYNNSTLNANNISLNSTDDTNIRGANVHANEQLMVDVGGDLNVESKQNRSRSSSVGASISGGFSFGGAEGDQASGTKSAAENGKSFSGAAKNLANLGGSNGKVSSVNVGASSNNSRSRSKETVLTSLTSGGSADINVKKNTHITGALIATQDENGKDLGNLNLTTKTLTYADLNNVNESSSRSTGISTSVGINSSANPADPAQQDAPDAQGEDNLRVNTTNIQHSNSSHYDKSKTLATLGQGNINIADKENSGDLDRLNRDVDNVDKDIVSVDRSKGNIDLTVDHRMLSEEGRKEIKEDFKRTGLLGEAIADIATEESVSLKDIFQHIGDVQKDLDVQKLMATQGNGENANILNDLANATPEQKQQAVNAYAKAYADVYDISIDEAKIVAVNSFTAGAHYSEDGSSSSIYVNDNAQNNALGYANTIGHEVTHAQIEQDTIRNRGSEELNEAYSDLRGNYAEDNYGFSFANNGLGTVNTGITNNYVGNKTSSLIAGNTTGLVTTARSNPGKMEYRPLEREETAVLNTVIGQIKESPYNSEAQNQLIGNAIAEACARTHCGEGVPESDEHYKTLQTLQQRGEALVENGQNMLANDAELFDYGWIDSKQDSLRANDEVITRVEGGAQGVLGAYGAAAGTVATVATSPACVSVAGCVAPAATAGLTALSANASLDGFNMMLGEYQSGFGQEVLNNLSADNYQDPSNPAGDLAIAAGTEVLLGATGRAAEKVADVADGIISSSRPMRGSDELASASANTKASHNADVDSEFKVNDASDLRAYTDGEIRPYINTSINGKVKVVDQSILPVGVQKTFKDKDYVTVETTESVILYRKFGGDGGQAKIDGGFASTKQNANRQETAVYPKWSTTRFEVEIEVPREQKLNIGKVAEQPVGSPNPKYRGNADQVLLPKNYPMEWIKSVRDGKTGKAYTIEEFKKQFPSQFNKAK